MPPPPFLYCFFYFQLCFISAIALFDTPRRWCSDAVLNPSHPPHTLLLLIHKPSESSLRRIGPPLPTTTAHLGVQTTALPMGAGLRLTPQNRKNLQECARPDEQQLTLSRCRDTSSKNNCFYLPVWQPRMQNMSCMVKSVWSVQGLTPDATARLHNLSLPPRCAAIFLPRMRPSQFPPAAAHSSRVIQRLILEQTPVWLTGPRWSVRIRDHTHKHRVFFSALLSHTR